MPLLSPQAPFKLTHGNLAKPLSVSVEYFSKKRERRKEKGERESDIDLSYISGE